MSASIRTLWIGEVLTRAEVLCLRSFLYHGHRVHLYVYGPVSNVPDGVELEDAGTIIPPDRVFQYTTGTGRRTLSGFSNNFRYRLLRLKGGWWVDTDVVCLRPFPDMGSSILVSSSNEYEWGYPANNYVMHAPVGHPFMQRLDDEASAMDPEALEYLQNGPFLVQRLIREMNLEGAVAPPHWFGPVNWRHVRTLAFSKQDWTPRGLSRSAKYLINRLRYPRWWPGRLRRGTYSVHLWNEKWNEAGIDKNGDFSRFCLYERLKRQYDRPGRFMGSTAGRC